MSFYGNSYQYLAETFAHVVLKNAGWDVSSFPIFENEDDKIKQIDVKATETGHGLSVFSGNRWITLKPVYEADNPIIPSGLEIWHESPQEDGELITPMPDILETVDDDIGNTAPLLDFDQFVKIPMIKYDYAGHVLPSEEAYYIKMVSDPTEPLIKRIEAVEKDMIDFKADVEQDMKDLVDTVDGKVQTVETIASQFSTKFNELTTALATIQQVTQTANNAKTAADQAKVAATKASQDVETIDSTVDNFSTLLVDLAARVTKLENN